MGRIISIHSYRGGTGKSNVTANIAYHAARAGQRVAVLDTDLQSPGVHVVFGFDRARAVHTLTDFVLGKCDIEEAAYDLGGDIDLGTAGGALYLLPSSLNVESITRIISDGYDVDKLTGRFATLMDALSLDVLLLDTHPGLNKETLLTTAISDCLLILIRPDRQDFHGTAVLVELAGRLAVPQVFMVANKVVESLDRSDVREKIVEAFGYEVIGVLPLSEEMARLGSRGLLAVETPDHSMNRELEGIARILVERSLESPAGRAERPPSRPAGGEPTR